MSIHLNGYRIHRQLGTGAGSIIYLAVETVGDDTRAIKRVLRNSADDDRFIKQAENEYTICSGLRHPVLRRTFEIHRIRKLLQLKEVLLVMEFVDGLTLDTARPNRLKTFLRVFKNVASGLRAMHGAGFVHSDIKPNNIMIARGGLVKIIDFGQSCPLGHRKERIQGTPDYIAPEQVRRHALDQTTDVFNLGATMYWVLTSELYPTELADKDLRGGMNLVAGGEPVAPIELNDKIPLSLSNLVMECCRRSRKERPSDMDAVIGRLESVERLWAKRRENARRTLFDQPDGAGEAL